MSLGELTERIGNLRREDEYQFVNTPPEATAAFLAREARRIHVISDRVWEPACGAGAIVSVLHGFGFDVEATDIRVAGVAGRGGVDFLATEVLAAPVIITNPPYAEVAGQFIRHAVALGVDYLALLLPSGFFQASAGNIALWREHVPSRIWPIGFRLDFTGAKKPLPLPHAWFVWDFQLGLVRGPRASERLERMFGERPVPLMPALTKEGLR